MAQIRHQTTLPVTSHTPVKRHELMCSWNINIHKNVRIYKAAFPYWFCLPQLDSGHWSTGWFVSLPTAVLFSTNKAAPSATGYVDVSYLAQVGHPRSWGPATGQQSWRTGPGHTFLRSKGPTNGQQRQRTGRALPGPVLRLCCPVVGPLLRRCPTWDCSPILLDPCLVEMPFQGQFSNCCPVVGPWLCGSVLPGPARWLSCPVVGPLLRGSARTGASCPTLFPSYLIITWYKMNETVFIWLDYSSQASTYLVLFLYE